jgi:c-di-GMP-binding flagellar brake protein YcgR
MDWNGIEKRRFVRANFPCKIIIRPPHKHTISTHTENISAGGVRVIIEERLEISLTVGLEIYLENEPIACKGRAVWVVDKESSYRKGLFFFDTGIEFIDIKEEDRQKIDKIIETIVFGEK